MRAGYGRLRYSQGQTEQTEQSEHMSTFELSQIIVENGITTRTELLEFAEELCGEEKTDIAEFVVTRGSLVVVEVLQTAWEIKSAKKTSSVQVKAG